MPQRQRLTRYREDKGTSSETGSVHRSERRGTPSGPPTRAYIRKWIHERAVGRLRQMVWEGHGSRLLPETSAIPAIRKFLAAIPRVLAAIKEVHSLAISDGAELLKARSAPPAPRELLLSKDVNGLTPLHKAAGLGNVGAVKVLLARAVDSERARDDQGKLPLHYAAYAVGSSGVKDENKELTYHLLVEAGSDESLTDNQGKTASYYLQHPGEIDSSRLRVIPEAPRTAKSPEESGIPASALWVSWRLIASAAEPGKKRNAENPLARRKEGPRNTEPSPPVKKEGQNPLTDWAKRKGVSEKTNQSSTQSSIPQYNPSANNSLRDASTSTASTPNSPPSPEQTTYTLDSSPHTAESSHQLVHTPPADSSAPPPLDSPPLPLPAESPPPNPPDSSSPPPRPPDSSPPPPLDSPPLPLPAESPPPNPPDSSSPPPQNSPSPTAHPLPPQEVDQETTSNPSLPEVHQQEPVEDPPPLSNTAESNELLSPMHSNQESTSSTTRQETITRQLSIDEERSQVDQEDITEPTMANEKAPKSNHHRLDGEGSTDSGGSGWGMENGERRIHNDEELRKAARDGDIALMVSMVLSGEGERLVGLTSADPNTQNFLSNVPFHMKMIEIIHKAACKGNIKEIQARLDRRKFAIAKEPTIGASPLHSAVLGASLNKQERDSRSKASPADAMIRYLGIHFPESLNQIDRYGRTPLHYSCALTEESDRQRIYQLLYQLGADPTIEDCLGHTPALYLGNPTEFPHEDLLPYMEYLKQSSAIESRDHLTANSLSEVEPNNATVLDSAGSSSDSDDGSSQSPGPALPMDIPVLWTEEGQYLAQSLGEPLVKGLAEVSQKRPKDPVGFLANYLKTLATNGTEATVVEKEAEHLTMVNQGAPNVGTVNIERTFMEIPNTVEERDEFGQTVIHKAASQSGSRGTLLHLIRKTGSNVGLRDELYRTPRDVAITADLQQNVQEIDMWILMLARAEPESEEGGKEIDDANEALKMLKRLLLEGYDHILDITAPNVNGDYEDNSRPKKRSLLDYVKDSSYPPIITLIKSIPVFEERREWLHSAIRAGSLEHTQEILFSTSDSFEDNQSIADESPPQSLLSSPSPTNPHMEENMRRHKVGNGGLDSGSKQILGPDSSSAVLGSAALAVAKNRRCRCSMHVAVLCQHLHIVQFIAHHFPQTLQIGDNLERTPLHYAMGVESVDSLSLVLIQAGAKRLFKDLKGRQPSYYFINKADIQKLQDEETFRD